MTASFYQMKEQDTRGRFTQMIRTEPLIMMLVIGLIAVFGGIAAIQHQVTALPTQPTLSGSSRQVAEQFLRQDATFRFDGIESSINLTTAAVNDDHYVFSFHFECLHGGYGDRAGQAVATVITPHDAVITIQDSQLVSAVMDNYWDMRAQGPV